MKIAPPTPRERRAARRALLVLVERYARESEGVLAAALLTARVEEVARDLCAELVHNARYEHGLTWSQVGHAFSVSMQSAHWRFTRSAPGEISRMRR